MIDLYASQPHYLDHLLDTTAGLDVRVLAPTVHLADHARRRGAVNVTRGNARQPGGPTLIAGYADADVHPSRPLGLVEHGAGQTYLDVQHRGYAGGLGWSRLDLVVVPGPACAQRWQATYPTVSIIERGAPRHPARDDTPDPVVAVTFHWPCAKTIEAGTAFYEWADTIADLRGRWSLLGHWHPKWTVARRDNDVARYWRQIGVPCTGDADEVFRRADLLVCDNSSLAYEWAAAGRPVVNINHSSWRRDVEHGLRFWSHVPGLMADPDENLDMLLTAALAGAGRDKADAAVAYVYRGDQDTARSALAAWVQSFTV